jgi:hypothetical protein
MAGIRKSGVILHTVFKLSRYKTYGIIGTAKKFIFNNKIVEINKNSVTVKQYKL